MRTFLLVLMFGWSSLHAAGLAVYPMEQFVSPAKPVSYTATNGQTKAIAVEVTLESWTISEDGEEVRALTEDLIAFPSQFMLKGNTSKRIKVGARDRTPVDVEKAYRVTVTELPVTFGLTEEELSKVYMANAYRTSFYVQPKSRSAKLELVESVWSGGVLSLTVRNTGTVHTHLRKPEMTLQLNGGETREFKNADVLDPLAGQNVHAQSSRNFKVDFAKELPTDIQVVGATLTLNDAENSQRHTFNLSL